MYSVNFIALFSLTAASPLTPEAVTEAAKEVDWWKLCWCLCVPRSKRDEILAHYLPEDLRRVVVDWWFSTDPTPSWRRLIHQLDEYGASETADKIRHNVEPVEGMLSTSLGTRLPYPKGEGESGRVAYREPLWATACMSIPKCQLKVLQRRC